MSKNRRNKKQKKQPVAKSSIDKKQNKQIKLMNKRLSSLEKTIEPYELSVSVVVDDLNSQSTPLFLCPLHSSTFKQYDPSTDPDRIRRGEELCVKKLECELLLTDMSDSYATRIIAVQYTRRDDVSRGSSTMANVYGVDQELTKIMDLRYFTSLASTELNAHQSVFAPIRVKDKWRDKGKILYDRVFKGRNNQGGGIITNNHNSVYDGGVLSHKFDIFLKGKGRYPKFEVSNDYSPSEQDILFFVFNSRSKNGQWNHQVAPAGNTGQSVMLTVSANIHESGI